MEKDNVTRSFMPIDMRQCASSVKALERPLLVATIAVTVLVAGGFAIGMPCGVWQWWCGMGVAAASCFWRKSPVRGLRTVGLFAVFLGLVWLCANVTVTLGWEDTLRYHQPAVRMLVEGWNPLRAITPDEISAQSGVPSDWMNVYHVIAMPRGVWYFCAAAYGYVHAPFNVLFPLVPFLFSCLALTLRDAFRPIGVGGTILAIVAVFLLVGTHDSAVDCVVAIAAVGLLATMYDTLRTGCWAPLRLAGYSFWMAVAKQPALLQCALFWLLFLSCVLLLRRGLALRVTICGLVAFVLFAVTSVSPYGTSWARFGHPFYPKCSGEGSQWPTMDITRDFFERNDAAAKMSHGWAYVNAFVSSTLCRTHYEREFGRGGFVPQSRVWRQQCKDAASGAPTKSSFRFFFCLTLASLLLLLRAPGAFLTGCFLAGTLAAPTEMVGYVRYVPWVSCAPVFLLLVLSRLPRKFGAIVGWCLCFLIGPLFAARSLMDAAVSIDAAGAIRASLRDAPPATIIGAYEPLEGAFEHGDTNVCANAVLLLRAVPSLRATKLVTDPAVCGVNPAACPRYYDNSFRVLPEYDLARFSEFVRLQEFPERRDRLRAYPAFLLRTYFKVLPRNIWRIVNG